MQAWLSADGVDIATIGFLSLVGLPYTFKFLWAPLMDRFEPPWLGRRRGWLVADAARARRRAVLDGGDAAGVGARRVRAARRPGRVALGVAGRRRRRLPHRPAAGGRARHRLVADRARLPAGDDPLGRHRVHLGRPAPGRRLDLARGLPRRWRCFMVGAAVFSALFAAAPGRAPRSRPASPATTCSAFSPSSPRSRSASSSTRYAFSPLGAGAASRRCFAGSCDRRRRWPSAGPTWSRSSPASAFTLPLAAWAARRARFETLLGSLAQLLLAGRRAAVPRLHRPLQARRRLRRLADDAVPAPGDALQHRRGRRRQQGDRPVADDRRRAGRRRADDPARPVARADAVRHPADARQPRLLVARACTAAARCPGS